MDSPNSREYVLPTPSRSIFHFELPPVTSASQSPASSPSQHIFPTHDAATTPSSFLFPSPAGKLFAAEAHPTGQAFTFPPSALLPTCPLSPSPPPSPSLFDSLTVSSSSSTGSYSRPSSPIPADAYIASVLSSPSEYSLPDALCGEELSGEVGDIGQLLFSPASSSSPSCTSPWSNSFEASGAECDSGSASGGSDSEGRGEAEAASDASTTSSGERDSQPPTDDDDTFTAASPASPIAAEPTKRRRKPAANEQQPTSADTGRKRRLTVSAATQPDDDSVAPEDKRERNKQSASDYRKRRKLYVVSLEQQLSEAKAALRAEKEEGKKLRGENTVLRASMAMMREFVHGAKDRTRQATSTRLEEQRHAEEEEEEEEAQTEAAKRWETAVSVRIPEEYRPVAPSQQVNGSTEQVSTHSHNTRKRRSTQAGLGKAGKQQKVGLTLFVLFSCFLLYFPWLADLSSSPLLLHNPPAVSSSGGAEAGTAGGAGETVPSSLFYNAAPDCLAQPALCHRGRTILELMEQADLQMYVDEHSSAAHASVAMQVEAAAASVKLEAPVDEQTLEDEFGSVMSPLLLPISAHNASEALKWLSEHAEDGFESLMDQAAHAAGGAVASEYDHVGWATASDAAFAQQTL